MEMMSVVEAESRDARAESNAGMPSLRLLMLRFCIQGRTNAHSFAITVSVGAIV
jgi:hypothetical protein